MKRILLTFLAVVVVFGLFAAVGYSGYRLGYAQRAQATVDGDASRFGLRPFDDFGPRGMFRHDFGLGRGFGRGFGGFPMIGFGFFPLLGLIAVLGLIVLFVYLLFTRSGWHLTKPAPVIETPLPPSETEPNE